METHLAAFRYRSAVSFIFSIKEKMLSVGPLASPGKGLSRRSPTRRGCLLRLLTAANTARYRGMCWAMSNTGLKWRWGLKMEMGTEAVQVQVDPAHNYSG